MLKKLLPLVLDFAGVAALYGGAATCFAAIILGMYLKYAWNIDQTKYYKMLAIAQGIDIDLQRKAAEERAAEIGYENVLEHRAVRNRQAEFAQATMIPELAAEPVPVPPKVEVKPVVSDAAKIAAFEKYIQDYKKQAAAAGLAEETRLLEQMEPEQAKEVIRKLWKDGANRRILEMLMAMEEKRRGEILYTMRQDKEEELKDLCELMQRIGNGEPLSSVIDEAEKNAAKQ